MNLLAATERTRGNLCVAPENMRQLDISGGRRSGPARAAFAVAVRPASASRPPQNTDPLRTWRPKGMIGSVALLPASHPDETLCVYDIFARTPMPIWDRSERLEALRGKCGHGFAKVIGVCFDPTSPEEHEDIERKVEEWSAGSTCRLNSTRRSSSRLERDGLAGTTSQTPSGDASGAYGERWSGYVSGTESGARNLCAGLPRTLGFR